LNGILFYTPTESRYANLDHSSFAIGNHGANITGAGMIISSITAKYKDLPFWFLYVQICHAYLVTLLLPSHLF
jgi:hypothetical protein